MEHAPNLVQALDQKVDVALVVVECHACTAGALLSQPGEQGLCAMVASPDADSGHVEDACHIVGMDALDIERDGANMAATPVRTIRFLGGYTPVMESSDWY